MTLPVILGIAGCAALLAGLFGGGVKAKEIVVPQLSMVPRIFSSVTGLVLIGIAIWTSSMPPAGVSSSPTATIEVPPTQISTTEVPATQMPTTEVPAATATLTEQPNSPDSMVTPIPQQADANSQAVFTHSALTGNMSGAYSKIEHALSTDPELLIFVMANYNSTDDDGGVYNRARVAVWYRETQWTIRNQDSEFMPQAAAFNVQILSEGDNAFIHTATSGNVTNSWTVIDHPLAYDPNALVFVMPTWSPDGVSAQYNYHPVGVWYAGSQWAIFNLDGAPMQEGAAFNVEILSAGMNAFVHTSTTSNTTKNWTVIDNPLAFDEDKLVFVTPRGMPEDIQGNNPRPIGVWYQGTQWAIFNQQNKEAMPIGAAFNILILDEK